MNSDNCISFKMNMTDCMPVTSFATIGGIQWAMTINKVVCGSTHNAFLAYTLYPQNKSTELQIHVSLTPQMKSSNEIVLHFGEELPMIVFAGPKHPMGQVCLPWDQVEKCRGSDSMVRIEFQLNCHFFYGFKNYAVTAGQVENLPICTLLTNHNFKYYVHNEVLHKECGYMRRLFNENIHEGINKFFTIEDDVSPMHMHQMLAMIYDTDFELKLEDANAMMAIGYKYDIDLVYFAYDDLRRSKSANVPQADHELFSLTKQGIIFREIEEVHHRIACFIVKKNQSN